MHVQTLTQSYNNMKHVQNNTITSCHWAQYCKRTSDANPSILFRVMLSKFLNTDWPKRTSDACQVFSTISQPNPVHQTATLFERHFHSNRIRRTNPLWRVFSGEVNRWSCHGVWTCLSAWLFRRAARLNVRRAATTQFDRYSTNITKMERYCCDLSDTIMFSLRGKLTTVQYWCL